jgi:hypothetical protein
MKNNCYISPALDAINPATVDYYDHLRVAGKLFICGDVLLRLGVKRFRTMPQLSITTHPVKGSKRFYLRRDIYGEVRWSESSRGCAHVVFYALQDQLLSTFSIVAEPKPFYARLIPAR